MLTTGSKNHLGWGAFGLVAAALYSYVTSTIAAGYGVFEGLGQPDVVDRVLGPVTLGYKGTVGDHFGYTVLIAFAIANVLLAIMLAGFRDADAEAVAEIQNLGAANPPIPLPQGLSPWPIVSALGVTLMLIGLVDSPSLFLAGGVILGVCTLEWSMTAWAEQATGDPVVNRTIRNRIMHPVEIPLAAVVTAGVVAVSGSRIFLALPKDGSWMIAIVLAAAVFGGALLLSTRPHIGRSTITPILVLFALVVVGLGIGGAVAGEREIEEHHSDSGAHTADEGS